MSAGSAPFRDVPPEERPRRRPPLGVIAAIACALVLAIVAWRKVAGYRSWPSVPHRLTWVAADGAVVGTKIGDYDCLGDVRFQSMVDGDRLWVICGSGGEGRYPNGALALLEPAQGRARIVGAFDRRTRWTTGILPGPDGTLAMVVSTFEPEGQIVAIASPEGWKRPPTPLPGTGTVIGEVGLLGMSFRGDALDVVVLPASAEDEMGDTASPTIVTLAPGAEPKLRTVSRATLHCEKYCRIVAAYRRVGDESWHFLVDDYDLEHGSPKLDVAEDGSSVRLPEGVRTELGALDLLRTGVVVDVVAHDAWTLLPDGKIERMPPADLAQRTSKTFRRDDAWAARIPTRYVEGPPYGMQRWLGSRTLITEHVTTAADASQGGGTPAFQDELFVLADTTDPTARKETTVARIHDCSNLPIDGTFLPRPGGWYFASPSGCYVTLDDALHRVDDWGLVDRLRMRGSMYVDWNEPSHLVEVGWALLGLPIALGGTWVLRRASVRTRRASYALAAVLYVVSAWIALYRVWPILR